MGICQPVIVRHESRVSGDIEVAKVIASECARSYAGTRNIDYQIEGTVRSVPVHLALVGYGYPYVIFLIDTKTVR
jgi:hypothetical protein